MILKVCGMKYRENIHRLAEIDPDWMGLIFYDKSPRNIEDGVDLSDVDLRKIGVFVNAPEAQVDDKVALFSLSGVQFHGDESAAFCARFKARDLIVIKSFAIDSQFDFDETDAYEASCDYFLFDTKVGTARGGTGQKFDWSVLHKYGGNTPFLLSGGIAPESKASIKAFSHKQWAGIDINSRFEIRPGYKDIEKIKEFKHELFS